MGLLEGRPCEHLGIFGLPRTKTFLSGRRFPLATLSNIEDHISFFDVSWLLCTSSSVNWGFGVCIDMIVYRVSNCSISKLAQSGSGRMCGSQPVAHFSTNRGVNRLHMRSFIAVKCEMLSSEVGVVGLLLVDFTTELKVPIRR